MIPKQYQDYMFNENDFLPTDYQVDDPEKLELLKELGALITDDIDKPSAKKISPNDPEVWTLDKIMTKDEVRFMLSFKKKRVNKYSVEQLAEMNKTAKAVQAKQTQEREAEVQLAREKAERQRAKADKAYREELGLSTQDFISLKWIETIAAKQGANIDVLVGGNTSQMWNVRR